MTESIVLLDNSTYFSFKRLIVAGELDADSLYNTATFLECLLTGERILTAPTLAWEPGPEDELFAPTGPCNQVLARNLSDRALRTVFSCAVESALQDVRNPATLKMLGIKPRIAGQTARLIEGWRNEIKDNPRGFLHTYSGVVLRTDRASRALLEQIATSVPTGAPKERHLAQYLLRTNVALEFAGVVERESIPYHPHSHRAAYVVQKLGALRGRGASIGTKLIREAESLGLREARSLRESSLLADYGAFAKLGDDAPLVLAVVLSGTENPSDIVKRTLELREMKTARRFRKWVSSLLAASQSGNFAKQKEAHQELELARTLLAEELQKLYGTRKTSPVGATAAVAKAVDLEALADFNARKLFLSGAKELLGGAPQIRELLERWRVRRKMVFLIKLVRSHAPEEQLDHLLKRVFHTSLPDAEVERIRNLRHGLDVAVKNFE